ncbi:MAG: Lon-insertion domain-containing protein, partial [Desulfobacterales bacterium]
KVRADFDYEVERTRDTIKQYSKFVARVCKEENLLPFLPGGVAAVVEYGEKAISDQNKLSLRFGAVVWFRLRQSPEKTGNLSQASSETERRLRLNQNRIFAGYQ